MSSDHAPSIPAAHAGGGAVPQPKATGKYDRTFQAAIDDGFLTVRQAVSRGNRKAYATELENRYELTVELALRVADNRIRLHQALRESNRRLSQDPARKKIRRRHTLSSDSKLVVTFILLTAVTAIGIHARHLWNVQTETGRRLERASLPTATSTEGSPDRAIGTVPAFPSPAGRIDLERDSLGRVTRLTGSHPAAILEAYCGSGPPAWECATFEVRPSSPPFPGSRTGRITLTDSPEVAWHLPIRRDGRTRRWAAGDGVHVIVPSPAPAPPAAAIPAAKYP